MQSLSKQKKGIKYLLRAIDLFSKYALAVPSKDKRGISIVNAFQKIISKGGKAESEGRRKPNKIWIDQGGKFYNKLFKRFLKIKNIEMYLTYNEGKLVVAERFIRTLKNKIFKHMTAVSKNVYFNVFDDIVNKHNNAVHRTIKIKPINVISDSDYIVSEYQNTKTFWLKDTCKIGQKKFLSLAKLKIKFRGHT